MHTTGMEVQRQDRWNLSAILRYFGQTGAWDVTMRCNVWMLLCRMLSTPQAENFARACGLTQPRLSQAGLLLLTQRIPLQTFQRQLPTFAEWYFCWSFTSQARRHLQPVAVPRCSRWVTTPGVLHKGTFVNAAR